MMFLAVFFSNREVLFPSEAAVLQFFPCLLFRSETSRKFKLTNFFAHFLCFFSMGGLYERTQTTFYICRERIS